MEKESHFAEWYIEAIDNAGIVDRRYPVKGMNVWMPYGLRLMRLINGFMRDEMARTGHEEVQFPVLVPEDQFQKEADHIKGFGANVYWVTHGGLNPLDVRLLLRPTSEAAMYTLYSLWIRTHTDLPLRLYQIVPVFRYETKQTRTFIRVRELSFFFESHTAHEDFDGAEEQIREDLEIWEHLARKYALPALFNKRPEWDKFAGAHYTVGVDVYVAAPGRAMQVASIHQYRDNFARVYDVAFEDRRGERQYAHQTTYGISERVLGAEVAIHGDDRGVILPPEIAPIQVVIIPILAKGAKRKILAEARALEGEIADKVRTELDVREMRPGAKFYEWERKGVPLRVELGLKEIEGDHLTLVRRDGTRRRKVSRADAPKRIQAMLDRIQRDLYRKAERELRDGIHTIDAYGDAPSKGIIRAGWCGKESCGLAMEEKLNRGILGTPYFGEEFKGRCLECGDATDTVAYAANSY
jgi:prolyl-tRNA synthetase